MPLGWTTEHLKQLHNSVPHNPLIAHPMYLAGYIEQLGTGIEDMISRLKNHGLPEPEFIQEQEFKLIITRPDLIATTHDTTHDTTHVTTHVPPQDTPRVTDTIKNLILVLFDEMSREELQEKLNFKNREHFRKAYLNVAIDDGLIEMTIPDKPKSIYQKYRLTEKGKKAKEQWKK